MTKYRLTSTRCKDGVEITLPLSKSISNRLILINALTTGAIEPEYADCDDTNAMRAALSSNDDYINIGAAGTAMRFLTAYYAGQEGRTVTLDGSERMRQRPISQLVDALRCIGADIEYAGETGYPPLRIKGTKLSGGEVNINASISSQFISALMMIGPVLQKPLKINLIGELVSRPYIEMTSRLMTQCGADVTIDGNKILVARKDYSPVKTVVEGDWSAASYWYEIVAVTGKNITLKSLYKNSLQGDSKIAHIFAEIGVLTSYGANGEVTLSLCKAPQCDYYETDLCDMPDIAQTLAVTLCLLGIKFKIIGLGTLPRKETDRLSALITELKKLGFVLRSENGDTLIRDGATTSQKDVAIATYKDHRMAMAFAPAVFKFGSLMIDDINVVTKSYPHFWEDLKKCGVNIEEI